MRSSKGGDAAFWLEDGGIAKAPFRPYLGRARASANVAWGSVGFADVLRVAMARRLVSASGEARLPARRPLPWAAERVTAAPVLGARCAVPLRTVARCGLVSIVVLMSYVVSRQSELCAVVLC